MWNDESVKNVLLISVVVAMVHWSLGDLRVGLIKDIGFDSQKKEVEIEKWVEPKDRSVVKTLKVPAEDSKKDESARFLGEFKNRVKKELQSPFKGRFSMGAPPRNNDIDDGTGPKIADLLPFGRTPNALPNDIESSTETLLNTDPVLYASFLNRVSEEIYDAWVSFARDAVSEVTRRDRRIESNTYVTRLQIVMDRSGSVMAMQTLHSSGIAELDDAPKRAFWDAEPFLNPPSQMFKNDNIVRFVYEFHFELKTSTFSIGRAAI